MTEQLYKIERRETKPGDMVVSFLSISGMRDDMGALYPVPEVHNLAWALGEMVRNERREYSPGGEDAHRVRFNRANQRFEWWDGDQMAWLKLSWFTTSEVESTSWSPVEAEPAISPGSRAWLASLPDGTEVVSEYDRVYTKDGTDLIDDCGIRLPISCFNDHGWRLRTQPQAEPTLEQRVERLERMMEVKP